MNLVPEPESKTKVELLREAQELIDRLGTICGWRNLPQDLYDAVDEWDETVDRQLDDRHGIY